MKTYLKTALIAAATMAVVYRVEAAKKVVMGA